MQWKGAVGNNPTWLDRLPSDELGIHKEYIHMYFNMLYERQNVWYNRFVAETEYPWTEDVILSENKFCNTYRILDRNSQWEVKNISLDSLLTHEFLWRTIFFRLFNQPEFFEHLSKATNWKKGIPAIEEYNADDFHQHMQNFRGEGGNPFTNAYLTNSVACPGQTRDWCFAYKVIPTLIESFHEILAEYIKGGDPKEFVEKTLTKIPSVSNFLAHEFYVSLCFREKVGAFKVHNDWTHDDYTNVGPGASLGLSLLFPNKKTTKEQYKALQTLRKMAPGYIKKNFPDFIFTKYDKRTTKFVPSKEFNLTLLTMEHGCCEFQKYWKMKLGVGKQRSKYIPNGIGRADFFLY